jgi:uncharacterized membrane protein
VKRTVVALFSRYDQAERAVDQLLKRGVNRNDISVMAANSADAIPLEQDDPETQTVKRAGAGAEVGGTFGAVLGLTALAIPGIGPIIAAGPIAGALSGGLLGGFLGLGISHDAARYYARGVEEGGAIVAVAADDDRADEVEAELDRTEGAQARHDVSAIIDRASKFPAKSRESRPMDATRLAVPPEEAADTRMKTDDGPEHWAPRNEQFTASFDEFAGVLARDESYVLAGRGGDYEQYREAFDFGYRRANESRFDGREWVNREPELRAEWEKRHSDLHWDRVCTPVQQGWEAARGMG